MTAGRVRTPVLPEGPGLSRYSKSGAGKTLALQFLGALRICLIFKFLD
jgi:hypothetical protein